MESPDGNGSSTGEGRKGALLLLRGGRQSEADGTSDRAASLPSSNALRPDSNLNLGWYRPAGAEEEPRESGERDEWSSDDRPGPADERHSVVISAAARLDFRAKPMANDPNDSPLGARRRRNTPTASSQRGGSRESGMARVGVARLSRLAASWLGPSARELRTRLLATGVAGVLLLVAGFAMLTVYEQSGNPHREAGHTGLALNPSQPSRSFLSEVTTRLDALSRSGVKGRSCMFRG